MVLSRRFAWILIRLAMATALASTLAGLASAASSVQAKQIRGSVKFYLDVRFLLPAGEGTFATSGAFTDSGTFESFPAAAAPLGKVLIWRWYRGKRGSIVMQELLGSTETGSWEILNGTGAYAHLRGHGTSVGVRLGSSPENTRLPVAALVVASGAVTTAARS